MVCMICLGQPYEIWIRVRIGCVSVVRSCWVDGMSVKIFFFLLPSFFFFLSAGIARRTVM